MFIKLAKLRARPSWGVAESMMSVSERRESSFARRLRSEVVEVVPRSATLCASSMTMMSQ